MAPRQTLRCETRGSGLNEKLNLQCPPGCIYLNYISTAVVNCHYEEMGCVCPQQVPNLLLSALHPPSAVLRQHIEDCRPCLGLQHSSLKSTQEPGLLTIKPWGTQETESISWKHQLDKALLLLPDYWRKKGQKPLCNHSAFELGLNFNTTAWKYDLSTCLFGFFFFFFSEWATFQKSLAQKMDTNNIAIRQSQFWECQKECQEPVGSGPNVIIWYNDSVCPIPIRGHKLFLNCRATDRRHFLALCSDLLL